MAAHLASLLPGIQVNSDPEPGPDRGAFLIGKEQYRLEPGSSEYVSPPASPRTRARATDPPRLPLTDTDLRRVGTGPGSRVARG
ncbi:hypothetical protein GCM10017771_37640 [Streptomyces capitiformicae]|uniref:Uncharacterized protein n=1 Tax=Streptomyces capitiformicae TaxID=2014920 RepID=A0A919GQU0_9ACTN|nr:hypothetical protein GCM10017771_37640 [Streptomyces capitiformicae]